MRRLPVQEERMERIQELASDIASVEAHADYYNGAETKQQLKILSQTLRQALRALEMGE